MSNKKDKKKTGENNYNEHVEEEVEEREEENALHTFTKRSSCCEKQRVTTLVKYLYLK